MKAIRKRNVILMMLSFFIAIACLYFASLAYLQKIAAKRVTSVIELLIKENPDIKNIHFQSITYRYIPFLHNKLTVKGVLISLKRNIQNPLIIKEITLRDFKQNKKNNDVWFQLVFTDVHFKHFKYSFGLVNQLNPKNKKTSQTMMLNERLKAADPSINGTLFYTGDNHQLRGNIAGLNYGSTFLHFNFSLNNAVITNKFKTLADISTMLSHSAISTLTSEINVSPILNVNQLSVVFPTLVQTLRGLGYTAFKINLAGYSNYSALSHRFKGSVSIQSPIVGKLGFSLVGQPDGDYFKTLFGHGDIFYRPHLAFQNYKKEILQQFSIRGLSLTYEDHSLLKRLLAYYAKQSDTNITSYTATVKNKLESYALMTDVPALNIFLNKLAAFINQPGRLQLTLTPQKPFLFSTLPHYFQAENKKQLNLEQSLVKLPQEKRSVMIHAYQEQKQARLTALLSSIGFQTDYVAFNQNKISKAL